MSHDHRHHPGPAPHRPSGRHAVRLFILNAVLYIACGAFAGLIVMDYLPNPWEMRVLAAFILVPVVMAVISTVVHVKTHRWTSVDDMAERFGR